MSEQQKFMDRFDNELKCGLMDIKFFVRHGDSLSTEDFFTAVNQIDEAIAAGKCERHTTWDFDFPLQSFPALSAEPVY